MRFFVHQALTGLWRSFGVTTLTVVTIGLALAVLATFAVVLSNLGRVADQLGKEVGITVYLPTGTDDAAGRSAAQHIAGWPDIRRADYVTSTAAMDWLRLNLGDDALVLEGLPADVLPPSVEVHLVAGEWNVARVEGVAERIRGLDDVDDVRYGQDDIERVNGFLAMARIAALVIALALCLASIFIVSNTIRLAVYARRDEIEIMSLIGATNAFVRTPFVLEGAIQGLLGGTIAVLSLILLRGAVIEGLRRGLAYAYAPVELEFLPLPALGLLVIVGVVLGLLGSGFAVGKFIKV